MIKVGNTVGASSVTVRREIWQAYDALPNEIRAALMYANKCWSAADVLIRFCALRAAGKTRSIAVTAIVDLIRALDQAEILEFQYCWPARFGRYPHVAADVSILRDHGRASRRPATTEREF